MKSKARSTSIDLSPVLSLNLQTDGDFIKESLERCFAQYHKKTFLESDPISIVHRYQEPTDQELVAFLCSLSAFGNVTAMKKFLDAFLLRLGPSPYSALQDASAKELKSYCRDLYYRFYTEADLYFLLAKTKKVFHTYGSLEKLYAESKDGSSIIRLSQFMNFFRKDMKSSGTKFMFPDVTQSSAKRIHLFLRWMVRNDEIDLGLWTALKPRDLIIPLDVHLFRSSVRLGLTKRRTNSLAAALEVTQALKLFDKDDPIRFDFALCRLGMFRNQTNV